MDTTRENIENIELYQALSDYIDQNQQQKEELEIELNDLKANLQSIQYTWRVGRFDSKYHCIVCDTIKGKPHPGNCWINNALK